jgi:lambda repressor-like predicted transcriptional regulator
MQPPAGIPGQRPGAARIEAAGGLVGLARRENISLATLRNHLRADGRLPQRDEDRLNPRGNVKITHAMLRRWATLGRARIEAVGGLDGLARRAHVSPAALKNYLRADGRLTQLGANRLGPRGNVKITHAMLRQWADLGLAGIQAAGGLDGLARRNNISPAALRNYLRADGHLTRLGEDRLNAHRNSRITDAMLRQWATLGRAGIEAAGGLGGLARRNNISAATLRNYLRADGHLTQYAEDRLNPRRNANVPNAV